MAGGSFPSSTTVAGSALSKGKNTNEKESLEKAIRKIRIREMILSHFRARASSVQIAVVK